MSDDGVVFLLGRRRLFIDFLQRFSKRMVQFESSRASSITVSPNPAVGISKALDLPALQRAVCSGARVVISNSTLALTTPDVTSIFFNHCNDSWKRSYLRLCRLSRMAKASRPLRWDRSRRQARQRVSRGHISFNPLFQRDWSCVRRRG